MIVVVCSALITKEKSVLLVHEKKMDKYGLPGGKLEEGETLRDCVMRECQEELGAVIEIDNLIMVTEKPKTRESNTVVRFIYRAHIVSYLDKAELDYKYLKKPEITKLINNKLVRGEDVAKLLGDYYQGVIGTIPDPIVFT
jgi:ADP-ribose pyrophosphatase YjhB (NUDIX family)